MNIDKAIAKLTQELGAETVADLIQHFFTDTNERFPALREAAERSDFTQVRLHSHSIAGSSSTFGLQAVRDAAIALEQSALAADQAAIPGGIVALAEAYSVAVPILERILQK